MDDADRAQQREEVELQRAIDAARGICERAFSEEPLVMCVDCGCDIEPVRIEHGYIRCFSCARDQEMYKRRFA